MASCLLLIINNLNTISLTLCSLDEELLLDNAEKCAIVFREAKEIIVLFMQQ